ncbi:MAG TPA: hypothetical protein VGG74_19385 [Kofleriaceae bacterium]|jgi:hypothetical protein
MTRTIALTIALAVALGACTTDDAAQTYEFATQTHDFVGDVGAVVNECFPASPADGADPPGEAAAMEFAGDWIASCEQDRVDGGWPANPACSMSYWPTGKVCE